MVLEAYMLTSSVVNISVCLIVQSFTGSAKTLHKVNKYYLSFELYPVVPIERDISSFQNMQHYLGKNF